VIQALRRVHTLDWSSRGLLFEAAALLFAIRAALPRFSFPTIQRALDRYVHRRRTSASDPRPVGWAIEAAARRLPFDTTCLVRALAADAMLRRRQLPSRLELGVTPRSSRTASLEAHAWVESDQTIVVGEVEGVADYARLSRTSRPVSDRVGAVTALILGRAAPWRALGATVGEVLETCETHDVTNLLHERLRRSGELWPTDVLDALERAARAATAREILRRKQIATAIAALHHAGVTPVLLKGTALAYTIYPEPAARPRGDTDLIIRREDVARVKRVMGELGYAATNYCDGELLFCQFEMARTDEFGIDHAFDFHWKISTQAIFADALSYDELLAESMPVAALGPHARGAGRVHALLLACIHPAMHHRCEERLLWLYDTHVLASSLGRNELERFANLAIEKKIGAVSAHELERSRARFETALPASLIQRLSTGARAEAATLASRADRVARHAAAMARPRATGPGSALANASLHARVIRRSPGWAAHGPAPGPLRAPGDIRSLENSGWEEVARGRRCGIRPERPGRVRGVPAGASTAPR
jgi:hypothetical protein